MHIRSCVTPILAAVASVAFALTWAGSAHAVVPGQNGKLAFVSNQDGDDEIYAIEPDGSGLARLTDNAKNDGSPAWSPDGRRVAFASNRDGDTNVEIYVMGADGSNPTRLTDSAGYDGDPVWSPDGQRIAFASMRDGNVEIYVMRADGTNQTRLTNNAAADQQPDWSPDAQQIVFTSNRAPSGPDNEVYVMGADGSSPTPLTSNAQTDWDPAWSPDGQRIAFASSRDAGPILDFGIYVMAGDGSSQTPLTSNHGFNRMPAWSPDGQKIAFNATRGDGQKVWIVNADGSAEMRVTSVPPAIREAVPDWQTRPPASPEATPGNQAPAGPQPLSTPGTAPTAPVAKPSISRLLVTPTRVRIGSRLPRLVRRPVRGPLATIDFRLSKNATVTLRFAKLRPNRAPRKLTAKVRIKARMGRNRIRFAARPSRRVTLKPGAYRLTMVATDAGGARSKPARTRFTAVNPTRR